MAANAIPIPMPVRGLNTMDPNLGFDSGYARDFNNWFILNGALVPRPSLRSVYFNATNASPLSWVNGNTGIRTSDGAIFTSISGATTAGNIGGAVANLVSTVRHMSLDLIIGARQPRLAASPFTAWTFTTAMTATAITSACSHKGRLYVCNGTSIEYSPVGAITGAMVTGAFDVSQFMSGQAVIRMFTFSTIPNATQENVLVIFGNAGRVLVYQGDYPASTTWNLIGQYDIETPISALTFAEVDNEIFFATQKGLYALSTLLSMGERGMSAQRVSAPIDNLFIPVDWEAAPNFNYLEFHRDLGILRLCISDTGDNWEWSGLGAPGDNCSVSLVYSLKYQAWSVWFHPEIYAYGSSLFGNVFLFENFNSSSFIPGSALADTIENNSVSPRVLQNLNIATSWKTPYFTLAPGMVQKIVGVRLTFSQLLREYTTGDPTTVPAWAYYYFDKVRAFFDYSDLANMFGWGYIPQGFPPILALDTGSQINTNMAETTVKTAYDVPDTTSPLYYDFVPVHTPWVPVQGEGGAISLQLQQMRPEEASANNPVVGQQYILNNAVYNVTAYIEVGGQFI